MKYRIKKLEKQFRPDLNLLVYTYYEKAKENEAITEAINKYNKEKGTDFKTAEEFDDTISIMIEFV